MCGRYVLKSAPRRIREQFGIDDGHDTSRSEEWRPRFNLAPSQVAPVVRLVDGQRHLDLLRWGLIPSWAEDPSISMKLINARSETAATKPAFRAAFRAHRCVVPADGFYEWKHLASGKQPYYIHRKDGQLLAMAGLWEHWQPAGADHPVETFTAVNQFRRSGAGLFPSCWLAFRALKARSSASTASPNSAASDVFRQGT